MATHGIRLSVQMLPIGVAQVLAVREPGVLHRRTLEIGAVHVGADRQVTLVGELAGDRLVDPVGDAECTVHHEYGRNRTGGVGARRVPAQLRAIVLELDGLHSFEHSTNLHATTRARNTYGSRPGRLSVAPPRHASPARC